jgi:hypothetical protein
MKIRSIILSALLLTTLAPAAYAGTKIMATGPGSRFYPTSQQLDCNILNANKKDKLVTIDIMDYFGNVVVTSGPILMPPYTGATASDNLGSSAWCRFTVDGNPKGYRAAAVYSTPTAGYTNVTPAY